MKVITTITLFLNAFVFSWGQSVTTKYYKDKYLYEEVEQSKAKFSKVTLQNVTGESDIKIYDIKKGVLLRSYGYNKQEPTGLWIAFDGTKYDTLDYSFLLNYKSSDCTNEIEIKDYSSDDASRNYVAPKLASGQTMFSYIVNAIRYPQRAKEMNIEGKVYLAFRINENGDVVDLVIEKGANPLLDKEAARTIGEMKFTAPLINGKPTSVCVKMPVEFTLN